MKSDSVIRVLKKQIVCFAEGEWDVILLKAIFVSLSIDLSQFEIVKIGGNHTKLIKAYGPRIQKASLEGKVIKIILDADDDISEKQKELRLFSDELKVDFDLYFLPNNEASGCVEDLLIKIIPDQNKSIDNCFEAYLNCISELDKKVVYNIPKARIHAYCGIIFNSNKYSKRDYTFEDLLNEGNWNIESPELNKLKEFLLD